MRESVEVENVMKMHIIMMDFEESSMISSFIVFMKSTRTKFNNIDIGFFVSPAHLFHIFYYWWIANTETQQDNKSYMVFGVLFGI